MNTSSPEVFVHRSLVGLAVSALACCGVLSACGTSDSSWNAVDSPTSTTSVASQGPGNALVVTDSKGRSFTLHPDTVSCGRSEYGHGVEVVKLRYTELSPIRGVDLYVVPVDKPTTWSLPIDGGDEQRGPRSAFVFVTARIPAPRAPHEPPAFENSTDQELTGSQPGGHLTVLHASCHPARLQLTIDGRLGSEYNDPDVTVTGGVDLTGR